MMMLANNSKEKKTPNGLSCVVRKEKKCLRDQGKDASCANCVSCPESGGSPVLSITGASALAGFGE